MAVRMPALSAAIRARASWLSLKQGPRQRDQHLVDVGGEALGLPDVLAVEQVAAWLLALDDAFVPEAAEAHAVTTTSSLFLPRTWQRRRLPSSASTR